jgi:ankyrin repeat protein
MAQKTAAEKRKLPSRLPGADMAALRSSWIERTKRNLSAEEQKGMGKRFFELAWQGNMAVLEFQISRLEKAGIDTKPIMNAKDEHYVTVLMSAARGGFADICGLLIEKGADVNARDESGDTALIYAASKGYAGICTLLIERGADANAKDNGGWTALHWAASRGYTGICKLLAGSGAGAGCRNNDNKTAAEVAALHSHGETAAYLKYLEPGKAA